MENISLLPPEIKAQQQAHRQMMRYLLTSGLVLLVFLIIYSTLVFATMQGRAEVRALQAQQAELKRETAGLQAYADLHAGVIRTENLLGQAMGTVVDWESVFFETGFHLPAGVWLTGVTAAYQAENAGGTGGNQPPAPSSGDLTLRGWAHSHSLVAQWLDELRGLPGLTDIRCQFSSQEIFEGRPAVQFEIKVRILPAQHSGTERRVGEGA